jgi:hypothetical protein
MRLLTFSDVLAIADPERQRLREADDAIRDIISAVDAQAAEDRLNVELISTAMIDLLLLAAARLALAARPKSEAQRLSQDFADLAQQALAWARGPGSRGRRSMKPRKS